MPNIPLRNGGPKARIAVIPGDGIGKEVTPEGVKVISAATAKRNRPLEFVEFDWGADKFLRENVTLPDGALEMLRDEFDAILFGALGDPRVPSNQHAADILLGLRFKLDLYVNARPTELLHDRFTPLRDRILQGHPPDRLPRKYRRPLRRRRRLLQEGNCRRNRRPGRRQLPQRRRAHHPPRLRLRPHPFQR